MEEMESLYKELLERMEVLENEKKKTKSNEGRISEMQLMIVRVQQILLSNLKPKSVKDDVENELQEVEIPEPVGKFVIENATGVMGNDGVYYHYAEVIKLLKLYKKIKE